jgi:hypothetical protein
MAASAVRHAADERPDIIVPMITSPSIVMRAKRAQPRLLYLFTAEGLV